MRFLKEAYDKARIELLYNNLNNDTKEKLGDLNTLVQKQGIFRNTREWEDALDMTSSVEEEESLARLFLELERMELVNSADQISQCEDIISKTIREIGFNYFENPILGFLKGFLKDGNGKGTKLNRNDAIILNNASADDIVTDNDLRGTGRDGKEHLLWKPSFWAVQNTQDKWNTLNAYENLSEDAYVKQLDLPSISNYLKVQMDANTPTKEVRDKIIYNGNKVRDFEQIRTALNIGKNNTKGSSKNNYETAVKSIYKAFVDASPDARASAIEILKNAGIIK